jgi:hypothetical protein
MNVRPTGKQRRQALACLVLAVVLLGAGLAAVVGGPATRGGSIIALGAVAVLLLSVLLFRTALDAGRGVLRRLPGKRAAKIPLRPTGPPIEQLAYDLRRLLWRHEQLSRSSDPAHVKWLRAVESTISSKAVKAARALDVPYQDPPAYGRLGTDELRRLLRGLAAAGLVLPAEVGLLAGGRY